MMGIPRLVFAFGKPIFEGLSRYPAPPSGDGQHPGFDALWTVFSFDGGLSFAFVPSPWVFFSFDIGDGFFPRGGYFSFGYMGKMLVLHGFLSSKGLAVESRFDEIDALRLPQPSVTTTRYSYAAFCSVTVKEYFSPLTPSAFQSLLAVSRYSQTMVTFFSAPLTVAFSVTLSPK